MKPSELLMMLLCSDGYYDPVHYTGARRYMCITANKWAYNKGKEQKAIANALTDAITKRLGEHGTLENHLFNAHGIARNNYDARYEWFFNLALELENQGQ